MRLRFLRLLAFLMAYQMSISPLLADTTSTLGREEIIHPDLGYSGGSALHTLVANAWTKVSNDVGSRYYVFTAVADSTTINVRHNFGVQFADLNVYIYTGTHPNLTSVPNPGGSGWTIAAGSPAKEVVDVTTPPSGGPWTGVVYISQGTAANPDASTSVSGVVNTTTQSFGGGKTVVGNADEIQLTAKGNATQTANIFEVQKSDATKFLTVDNSGNAFVKNAVGVGIAPTVKVQIGDAANANSLSIQGYGASASGNYSTLDKSRNATVGSHTIVQSGDVIGGTKYRGSNGTSFDIAAKIEASIDATPGASADMPGRLTFFTTPDGSATPVERLAVTNGGNILANTTSVRTNFTTGAITPLFQIEGTTDETRYSSLVHDANSTAAPGFLLGKTRGTTLGSNTIVQSGDGLGFISFQGSDGTNLVQAASIDSGVDGTPGSNDMPGRLRFSTTPDGSATPTEKMRITNDGKILQGTTSARTNLSAGTETPLNAIESLKSTSSEWFSIIQNPGASTAGPIWALGKTRSSSANGNTIVQSGDQMGFMLFMGNDGTNMVTGAGIGAAVDGTPGSGDMPGKLRFYTTADGASAITERMSISNAGLITLGSSGGTQQHVVNGHINTTATLSVGSAQTTYGLHVKGTADDNTNRLRIDSFSGTASKAASAGIQLSNATSDKWYFINDQSATNALIIQNATPTTLLSVTQSGAFTIGASGDSSIHNINGGLKITKALVLTRVDDASTGTINNLSSSGISWTKFTAATTITLNGIAAGVDGQRMVITNVTGNAMTITHNSGSATGATIRNAGLANISLGNQGSIEVIYDNSSGVWWSISK